MWKNMTFHRHLRRGTSAQWAKSRKRKMHILMCRCLTKYNKSKAKNQHFLLRGPNKLHIFEVFLLTVERRARDWGSCRIGTSYEYL